MGVTGLWKLIEPCGKPVPVETLEGKILAVDISIWLHQVVKGFQDNKGSALNNAHLLGLFNRLCKLLYYRVRPIFIFDGCVPQLKRDTIAKRQRQRSKLNNEADRIQVLLLQSLAKEKVVQQALGINTELLLKSPLKRATVKTRAENVDDLFKLPELPVSEQQVANDENNYINESDMDDYTSATDSSYDESNPRNTYSANLQAIDVRSKQFLSLPADVRHEILTDIKETRKQSSWGRLHELPSHSEEFSTFQMKRLLKRRAVQESLEAAEQEMGGRTLTYAELSNLFTEEGIITPSGIEEGTKRISSDENTRYLLVRDLKKQLIKAEREEEGKCETIKEEPSISVAEIKKTELENKDESLGKEYDADLELAIALSLEQTKVYDEKDYDYDSDQELKLNREQSKQLRNAAKGPARTYMIEYGGMNIDEVENIMEKTQELNETAYLERLVNDSQIIAETKETKMEQHAVKLDENMIESVKNDKDIDDKPTSTYRLKQTEATKTTSIIISDSDDDDFEEVVEDSKTELTKSVEIVLDNFKPEEDLFADIFENEFDLKKIDQLTKLATQEKNVGIIEIKDSQELIEKNEQKTQADLTVEVKKGKYTLATETEIVTIKDSQELVEVKTEKPIVSGQTIADKNKMPATLDEIKKTANVNNIEVGATTKTEIIEIPDSNGEQTEMAKLLPVTPQKQKTPMKNTTITNYFQTEFFIKRTPDTPKTTEETPPKVKSPFFIKKTPKSGKKRASMQSEQNNSEESSPEKTFSKAARMLFNTNIDVGGAVEQETAALQSTNVNAVKEKITAVEPVKETPILNLEEIIKEKGEILKSQKTEEELTKIAEDLVTEYHELEAERNRQDRMGISISQRMNADCQELLRLFGVPYIVAPMEAEAQCAYLNAVELTHGTITDDSDIWLFGGRTVYKNFFAQNKHVLEYRAEQIERHFNCDRKKLIQLACLVGSDYTTGIHGIGAVTALEILATFSSTVNQGEEEQQQAESMKSVLTTLTKFRDWWQAYKNTALPGSSAKLALRKKLKNIELHEGFPSMAVIEAYLVPKVDENKENFSWGTPDLESIREFARKAFGWTTTKTNDILMPVMKKIKEKKTQGSIINYFAAKNALRVSQLKVSKRVQAAIDKMSGKVDEKTTRKIRKTRDKPVKSETNKTKKERNEDQETAEPAVKLKKVRSETNNETKKETNEDQETAEPAVKLKKTKSVKSKRKADGKQTQQQQPKAQPMEIIGTTKPHKCPRLPNTKEVIPQRVRDLEQLSQNKEKATALLKKSAAAKKKA